MDFPFRYDQFFDLNTPICADSIQTCGTETKGRGGEEVRAPELGGGGGDRRQFPNMVFSKISRFGMGDTSSQTTQLFEPHAPQSLPNRSPTSVSTKFVLRDATVGVYAGVSVTTRCRDQINYNTQESRQPCNYMYSIFGFRARK